jgi:putative solute:sodium symporter small subunit
MSQEDHQASIQGSGEPAKNGAPSASDEIGHRAYWRANVRTLLSLLSVWFFVSFGCGILWVDALNAYSFFGWKLGFWFSQQGSIYAFVVLIFVYVAQMNALDRRFNVDEDR